MALLEAAAVLSEPPAFIRVKENEKPGRAGAGANYEESSYNLTEL